MSAVNATPPQPRRGCLLQWSVILRAPASSGRLFALATNAPARATYESAGFAPYEILYEKLVDNALR